MLLISTDSLDRPGRRLSPGAVAALFASFDANIREDKVDVVTSAVQQLTGKAPETLRDFLQANY